MSGGASAGGRLVGRSGAGCVRELFAAGLEPSCDLTRPVVSQESAEGATTGRWLCGALAIMLAHAAVAHPPRPSRLRSFERAILLAATQASRCKRQKARRTCRLAGGRAGIPSKPGLSRSAALPSPWSCWRRHWARSHQLQARLAARGLVCQAAPPLPARCRHGPLARRGRRLLGHPGWPC